MISDALSNAAASLLEACRVMCVICQEGIVALMQKADAVKRVLIDFLRFPAPSVLST